MKEQIATSVCYAPVFAECAPIPAPAFRIALCGIKQFPEFIPLRALWHKNYMEWFFIWNRGLFLKNKKNKNKNFFEAFCQKIFQYWSGVKNSSRSIIFGDRFASRFGPNNWSSSRATKNLERTPLRSAPDKHWLQLHHKFIMTPFY